MSIAKVSKLLHKLVRSKIINKKVSGKTYVSGNRNNGNGEEQEFNTRLKLPRGREVIGIITQRVGGVRMLVSCMDGKTRNCRVPGRLKRDLWLREGDIVIIEPWEFEGDEKGDVLYKYSFRIISFH